MVHKIYYHDLKAKTNSVCMQACHTTDEMDKKSKSTGFFIFKKRNSSKTQDDKKLGRGENDLGTTNGMRYVNDNLIGRQAMILGPFGERRITYADQSTPSSLYMIENYMMKYVYSYYDTTNCVTSFNAKQTTSFRNDAETIIRQCCNANDEDLVISIDNGCTSAIQWLINELGMTDPGVAKSSVVFVGPFELTSNVLPWKETGAKIVRIGQNNKGHPDQKQLQHDVKEHSRKSWKLKVRIIISAKPNLTGNAIITFSVAVLDRDFQCLQ